MAKLESLIVDVQAETAKLRSGLDDAKKQLKDFDKTLKELAGVVEFKELGEMALEVGRKLAEVAIQGAEVAEGLVHLSESTGISVEQLQRLQFAAKAGGLEGDSLAKAFNKLDQALAKAAAGVPQQAALFNALGVAVKDAGGKVRGTDEVLADVSERFAGMADGASKAALAAELFGTKNGAALIPLLNSLKETEAEADRLGIVIDAAGIKAAAGFAENLHKLDAALEAVKLRVAAELGPSLTQLTDELLKSQTGADSLKELAESLAAGLRVLATTAVVAANGFQVLGKFLAANISAGVHLLSGNLSGALDDVKNFASDAVDEFQKAGDRLTAIWDPATKSIKEGIEGTGDAAKASADKTLAAFEAQKKALENYKTSVLELQKLASEEQAKVSSFGLGPVDQLIAKLDSGALTHGITHFTDELGKARDRLIEVAKELADLTAQHANISITFELKQKIAGIQQGSATMAQDFQNIGDSDAARRQAESLTGGFHDFTQALQVYTEESERAARDFADSQRAQAANQTASAEHLKEFGEQAQLNAEAAKRAAGGFKTLADLDLKQTEASINEVTHGITAAASMIASKLGTLGEVIQSGVQGFQSGGPWGALFAVVIDLFSRFKRFAEIIAYGEQQVGGLIEMLSGAFSKLTDGFKEFMQMQGILTQILGDTLGPAIREAGRMFSHVAEFFAPMLNSIEILSSTLGEIVGPFQDLIDAVDPLKDIIKGVAAVFNIVSLTILGTIYGVETMFAQILKGIRNAIGDLFGTDNDAWRGIYDAENKLDVAAGEAADKMNQIATHLGDSFAAGSGVGGAPQPTVIQATLFDTYMQVGNLGTVAKTTSDALAKMTEQITNVPQGFKYALEKFDATNPSTISGSGTYGSTNGIINVQVTVQGSVVSEQNLVSAVRKGLQVSNFRNNGVPHFP